MPKSPHICRTLRRYARALTGSQTTGDAFVKATLEAALADQALANSLKGGRVPLYAAFNKLWASAYLEVADDAGATGARHERAAQDQLRKITPLNRQALLLTTVEDFSPAEAAQIMDIAEADVGHLVREAIEEIDRENTTSVLIIEDEPLISMQLEDLVRSIGHDICGTAATRTQAQQVVAETPCPAWSWPTSSWPTGPRDSTRSTTSWRSAACR